MGNPANPRGRKAKTSTFYAHRFILELSSQTLADSEKIVDMSCNMGDSTPTPVHISGIKPEVFKNVLYFCYGGKISDEDMKAHTRGIIEAADRFGIVPLKLAAEASYIESTKLSVENILEVLTYAYDNNLDLLKETATEFIAWNQTDIAEADISFDNIPSNLTKVFLTATKKPRQSNSGDEHNTVVVTDYDLELATCM